MLGFATRTGDVQEIGAFWRWQGALLLAVIALVLCYVAPVFSREVFLREGWGPVEFLHVLMPACAAIVAARAWYEARGRTSTGLALLIGAFIVASIYVAGEECSWGQSFFKWGTPEYWSQINRQQETNLHNTSTWWNHKPRTVLEIGIFVATVLVPLCARFGLLSRLRARFAFILPERSSWPMGWFATFYLAWDHMTSLAGFPRISTRESEIQETFVYGFLLIYAITLAQRMRRAAGEAGAPEPAGLQVRNVSRGEEPAH